MDATWLDSVFSEYAFDEWSNAKLKEGVLIEVVDRSEPHVEGNYHTDLYIVFRVVRDGEEAYFRKTGYYASHDGEYWDGPWTEVKPQQRAVTTWEEADEYDSYDYESSYSF